MYRSKERNSKKVLALVALLLLILTAVVAKSENYLHLPLLGNDNIVADSFRLNKPYTNGLTITNGGFVAITSDVTINNLVVNGGELLVSESGDLILQSDTNILVNQGGKLTNHGKITLNANLKVSGANTQIINANPLARLVSYSQTVGKFTLTGNAKFVNQGYLRCPALIVTQPSISGCVLLTDGAAMAINALHNYVKNSFKVNNGNVKIQLTDTIILKQVLTSTIGLTACIGSVAHLVGANNFGWASVQTDCPTIDGPLSNFYFIPQVKVVNNQISISAQIKGAEILNANYKISIFDANHMLVISQTGEVQNSNYFEKSFSQLKPNTYYAQIEIISEGQRASQESSFVIYENSPKFKIATYPNPVQNRLTIDGLPTETTDAFIYNYLGTLLARQKVSDENNILNIENYSKGIYILVLSRNGEKIYSEKIYKD